jgi:hypothetical protein
MEIPVFTEMVLTTRLQFRPCSSIEYGFYSSDTRCVDSDDGRVGVVVVIYMWTEMRTWLERRHIIRDIMLTTTSRFGSTG